MLAVNRLGRTSSKDWTCKKSNYRLLDNSSIYMWTWNIPLCIRESYMLRYKTISIL